MADRASIGNLAAAQFDAFREWMFSRVYTTVPSITELLKQAILRWDRETAATAIRNLMEEGGEGVP